MILFLKLYLFLQQYHPPLKLDGYQVFVEVLRWISVIFFIVIIFIMKICVLGCYISQCQQSCCAIQWIIMQLTYVVEIMRLLCSVGCNEK